MARRRVAEEKLATVEDIFFLTVGEALAMPLDARLRVKRRATERERLHVMRLPPVIDGAWAPVSAPEAAQAGDELCGQSMAGGVAEGTIRVLGPDDVAELQPGDIAVSSAADVEPVLLLGAPAAVITDSSPSLGDPAGTAAALGIPLLGAVAEAGIRLVNGMRVRVDAKAGTLTVLAVEQDAATEFAAQAQS